MPQKVLVVGPVNGRFRELVSKVSAIQSKHGPFTACFVLGDFFHPDTLAQDSNQDKDALLDNLPVPTYFYQASLPFVSQLSESELRDQKAKQEGFVRVAQNLYRLREKSGVVVTREGLRVAYVGGVWDATLYAKDVEAHNDSFDPETWYESSESLAKDRATAHITPSTINRLLAHPSFRLPVPSSSSLAASIPTAKPGSLAAARATASAENARTIAHTAALETLKARPPIDLLLTNCWPTGVTLFSPSTPADPTGGLPDPTARMWGSPAIARIASHACPRYHFSIAPYSLPSDPDANLPVGIATETLEMGAFWERAPYTTDLSTYLTSMPSTPQAKRETEKLKTVTRFVSLAKFANDKKRRWFLALNLTPAEQQHETTVPANATQTPYSTPQPRTAAPGGKRSTPVESMDGGPNYRFQEFQRKRARPDSNEDVPPAGYVCRICNVEGHFIRSCPSKQQSTPSAASGSGSSSNAIPLAPSQAGGRIKPHMQMPAGLPVKPTMPQGEPRRQLIPVGPSNCWFCLSNPTVTKSLIVAIAAESYLAFPKGGFLDPTINTIPSGGSHLLIIPLAHTSSLLPLGHAVLSDGREGLREAEEEEEEERRRTKAEMEQTKLQIRSVWASRRHVMLEWTLVRVRTSRTMTHFQTQLLALLSDLVDQKQVVKVLDDALERLPSLTVVRDDDEIEAYLDQSFQSQDPDGPQEDGYFHMALHPLNQHVEGEGEGGKEKERKKQWLIRLNTTSRFPVQFVRTTLSAALELPHLADWKSAQASQVQEGLDEEQSEKNRSSQFRRLLIETES